jgi:ketosteroid isomerase-like protein
MYHAIVRRLIRNGFAALTQGDARPVVTQFAREGTLTFSGTHALGGERRGPEAVAAWFAQLQSLFPGLRITPLAIVVAGWPWNTTVATRFRVDARLPDGTAYENEGMQFVRVRFGRILEDHIYEDTAKLERALETIAERQAQANGVAAR